MDRTASRRPASRLAVRALALAALPVLLVTGCSSSSDSSDDATQDNEPQSVAPTPEPVRFEGLPEPCETISQDTIGEVVPQADPEAGETLSSSDTATSAACLWSGLDDFQFRSLTVALRRFDSDLSLGSGDERATEYLQQMVDEVTGDDANRDVESAELAETGDAATSVAYSVTKTGDGEDDEQDYRQQRVVSRVGNVVLTLDYSGAGFEGDDMPSADSVREAAETAAREAAAAVDASADATGGEAEEDAPAEDAPADE
ncbi:DUF3558 domain-containing protein [Streptomyces millisiae]|uniref:DUF3558 domain-containing protein n=1 Tax=Streptomyces millisiae TaxID=3075542 RepID=A0ABU2LU08_9ACTN|nr:DUF3558 domain-containing protein [Streptomyces sp. DSM 44918]MDT0321086.1 DUF3558 domain-containing protein [Streptomyces sp. DSM 44918]